METTWTQQHYLHAEQIQRLQLEITELKKELSTLQDQLQAFQDKVDELDTPSPINMSQMGFGCMA